MVGLKLEEEDGYGSELRSISCGPFFPLFFVPLLFCHNNRNPQRFASGNFQSPPTLWHKFLLGYMISFRLSVLNGINSPSP
jgi:hypothetical protein